jgi:HK97 family phage major capsid protein
MFTTQDLEATRTVEEVVAFKKQIAERTTDLDTEFRGRTFDDAAREEFASLKELTEQADMRETEFRARRQWVEAVAKDEKSHEDPIVPATRSSRQVSRIPEDVYDLAEYRSRTSSEESMTALLIDGARKASEQAIYPHDRATDERTVGHIHKLLERIDAPAALAQRILSTGSPAYSRAFGKAIVGLPLTADEQRAIAVVGSGAVATGGYAVPYQLDPTIILTSDGQVNPLRQISRVEQITGNTWKGVSSAGITVSRGAEAAAITATSPTLAQPSVTVQSVKAEIDFSIEADEDWARLQSEMARVLQDAKDSEEADAFVNGVGTTVYPAGVVETLAASSKVGTTGDGFDVSDLYVFISRLPDRFEPRARFLGHRAVYNQIAQFASVADAGAGAIWRTLGQGQPAELLGYPAHRSSAMEDDYTTAGSEILLFGDFNYFLIAEKIGMSVELDPHVRDGNGKWTGQRALLAHWRNSSLILTSSAFRLLTVGVVTSGV